MPDDDDKVKKDKNGKIIPPTTARSLRRDHLVDGTYRVFVKNYRTEIAASCASLASTLIAVSLRPRNSYLNWSVGFQIADRCDV